MIVNRSNIDNIIHVSVRFHNVSGNKPIMIVNIMKDYIINI
jgi:hypothetical protein